MLPNHVDARDQAFNVPPWALQRVRGRGHGRARREHIGAFGEGAWFGPSGQQSLLSCGVTASCEGWLSVRLREVAMMSFNVAGCARLYPD